MEEYAKDMEDMTSEQATSRVKELEYKYSLLSGEYVQIECRIAETDDEELKAVRERLLKVVEAEKDETQKEITYLQDSYVMTYEE
jgi:hypothetical protein